MENLGFYINYEKSNLIPSTRIEYLGHLIDSVTFKVYLPDEKVEKILISCAEMLNSKTCKIRTVAHLIGLFTSAKNAIRLSPLLYRYLNRDKIHALAASNNDYEVFMTLSGEAKNEIRWWQNNIFDKNGKDIRPSKIQFYLETDASKAGWVPIFMV